VRRDPCTILPVQEGIPRHPKVVSAEYFIVTQCS
jgi:hypothetical protein